MDDDMVMMVAYVKRTRRALVGQALRQLGLEGWTESDVLGHGHAAGGHGVEHMRVEVLLAAEQASACSLAIATAASDGSEGNGLVMTLPVRSVERIGKRSPA
jgi:nitrogen regulatory protein PII